MTINHCSGISKQNSLDIKEIDNIYYISSCDYYANNRNHAIIVGHVCIHVQEMLQLLSKEGERDIVYTNCRSQYHHSIKEVYTMLIGNIYPRH